MTMTTGCKACDQSIKDKSKHCDKHHLEYLKWLAKSAQSDYLEELRKQSRKGTETERNQNEKL